MSNTLGKGSLLLSANTGALAADLNKANSIIGGFAIKAGNNITSFFSGISAGVTTALSALSGFIGGINDTIESIGALNDAANSLGIAVEVFQGLAHAAGLSGVGVEGLTQGLTKMTQIMGQALDGSASAISAFAAIGITVADLQGKSPEEVLMLVADGLAAIDNPAQRTAAAMEIFGKSGARLLPFLSAGSAGIRDLQEEAAALGLVLSADAVANIDALGDELDKLKGTAKGAFNILTASLAPALIDIAKALIEGWKEVKPAIDSAAIALGDLFMSFGPIVTSIFGALKEFMPVIQFFATSIGLAARVTGFLISKMFDLTKTLYGGLFAALKMLKPIWDSIWNSGPVKTLVGWINNIVKAVEDLIAWIRTIPGLRYLVPAAPPAAGSPAAGGASGSTIPAVPSPLGSWAAATTAASAATNKAVGEMLHHYNDLIKTVGKSETEILVMNLTAKGATDAHIAAVLALKEKYDELKKAADLKKELAALTTSLETAIATFGMTADAVTLYTLALKGADAGSLAKAKGLMATLDALKKQADLMKTGAALTEKYKSPAEKLQDELAKLDELWAAGAISAEVYALAVQDAMKGAAKALGMGELKTASAALQGSAEATEAIIRHQMQGQIPALSLESILKASKQIQASTLGTAKGILAELKTSGRRMMVGVV